MFSEVLARLQGYKPCDAVYPGSRGRSGEKLYCLQQQSLHECHRTYKKVYGKQQGDTLLQGLRRNLNRVVGVGHHATWAGGFSFSGEKWLKEVGKTQDQFRGNVLKLLAKDRVRLQSLAELRVCRSLM